MAARKKVTTCLAVTGMIAMSGCGGSSDELETLQVLDTAGMPSAFLQYGINEGHFEEVGLEINLEESQGGAAAIPALISGETHFAGSNAVSVVIAAEQGLPVQIAAGGIGTSEDADGDYARVFSSPESETNSVEDLGDARFAVNTLENINDIALMTVLEDRNIDYSGLEFVEMPFPDMLPALASGDVDAALLIEPFVTMALQEGFEPVLSPYAESRPGLMIGTYLTSEEFAEDHPGTVDAFRNGVISTAQHISDDPEAFREALPELSEIDEDLTGQLHLGHWSGEADRESIEFIAEQMVNFDMANEVPDLDSLLIYD